VALVYFDASAFVKLVVDEDGSELAAQLWDGCDSALSSRLAYPEVCAALAASRRNHDLGTADLAEALASWAEYWAAVRPVELTAEVEQHAGKLAGARALRGADAVHLASALAVGTDELVIAVWDTKLHAAATAEGFATAPADLEG
jgi:uncharacterized protein